MPARNNRRFLRFVQENYTPEGTFGSPEELIKNALSAYKKAMSESNKMFALSAISTACFAIKIAGLRLDLIFIDKKIFEIPYGIFVFCCASQIFYTLGILRGNDARFFERLIKSVTEAHFSDKSGIFHLTLVGESNWLTPQFYAVHKIGFTRIHKALSSLFYSFVAMFLLALYTLPIVNGFYFLLKFPELSGQNSIALQWWAVTSTTLIALASFLVNASFQFQDIDE